MINTLFSQTNDWHHRYKRMTSLKAILKQAALLFTLAAIAFIPLSHALLKHCIILATLLACLSIDWSKEWPQLKKLYTLIFGLAFLTLFGLGVMHSQAPLSLTLRGFFKYTKILYLIALIPLFRKNRQARDVAEYTLFASLFFHNAVSTVLYLGHWTLALFTTPEGNTGVMVNAMCISILTAFAIYALSHRCLNTQKRILRALYLTLLLFFTFYLFFINHEKSGILLFLFSMTLLLWQKQGNKGLCIGIITVPLLLISSYFTVPGFHNRLTELKHNLVAYQHHTVYTSIGLRLAFAKNSFTIIKKQPVTGTGTGSFSTEYAKTGGIIFHNGTFLLEPHNQYLIVWVELGIIGLLFLFLWLGAQILESFELPQPEQALAQGLILMFIITSFCFTTLYFTPVAYLYIIFLAISYATKSHQAPLPLNPKTSNSS